MRRVRLTYSFFLLILAAGSTAAQEFVPNRFIVELAEPGKGSERQASAQKDALRAAVAERAGVVRDSLERVMNALIVDIDEARRAELEAMPGVRKVYRDRKAHFDMDHAVGLVKAREAWRMVGGDDQAGKGMKIAIVDTGIDITHPAFKDDSLEVPGGYPKTSRESDLAGTNRKVIIARSYGVRGTPDIRDMGGHGSAVASVAAGARHASPVGEFAGIAPKAFLALYRLDDTDGSFTSSGLMRALEDVAADGVDVMNLSIGFFPQTRYEDDPVAKAVEKLAERVIVSKSAGNMGPDAGLASAPASPSAITVGASWNDRALGPSVEVPGLGGMFATRPDIDLPTEPLTGELVDAESADPTSLVCREPAAGSFDGKIVLILRGDCLFETKLINAKKAGAKGAIIYTNSNPIATLWSIGSATLPSVMVTSENGLKIRQAIAAESGLRVKISFDLGTVSLDADQMTSFSSRGPGVAGNIHVDLVAPGDDLFLAAQKTNPLGEIYSSTGYAVEAGTSFSSPMVAGGAAVLKAARPGLKVKQYKSLLVNSAAEFAAANGKVFGVQAAGAGRLDMERALRSMTVADPVTLSFGAGRLTADVLRDLTLTNLGSGADTLSITVSPLGSSAAPVVSPAVVNLGVGESRVVTVRLSGNELTPGEHQGFLLIRGNQSEVELRVPYWYGASDKVVKTISLMARTSSPRAGERYQFLMRIADASGTAVVDRAPTVEALAGDGRVEMIQSLDADYPGMWVVVLRLGPVAGVSNVFRFKMDGVMRMVSLLP
jgi:subtilisin family serine protease